MSKKRIDNLLAKIAKSVTGIETLEEQKNDSLDFHELSVCDIKEMLEKAYEVGLRDGLRGQIY